jgi:endonuclease/exonuclease/phosphatase family metal-dependent hydrolase
LNVDMSEEIKILTFNIHKGFSLFNRRHSLSEIRQFLEQHHPDLVFLQEVRGLHITGPVENQLEHLADRLWEHTAYGKNAVFIESHHGNAILSRYPFDHYENRNVSLNRLERRGILYGKIAYGKVPTRLHVFCLHFNLLHRDRLLQADELLKFIEEKVPVEEPLIVAGDFNDWAGRLVEKLSAELDLLGSPDDFSLCTFPSFFPIFRLDRIFARNIELLSIEVVRPDAQSGMSDHLPLMARVRVLD